MMNAARFLPEDPQRPATVTRRDVLLSAGAMAALGAMPAVAQTPPRLTVQMDDTIPWASFWEAPRKPPPWTEGYAFHVTWQGPPPSYAPSSSTDPDELAQYELDPNMPDLRYLQFPAVQMLQTHVGSMIPMSSEALGSGSSAPVIAGAPAAGPSMNWCGVYMRKVGGRKISKIRGRWEVPKVSAPPKIREEARMSQWIGLDGCDPTSRAMPQIGTLHMFRRNAFPATERHRKFLWWQWWIRDLDTHQEPNVIQIYDAAGGRLDIEEGIRSKRT